LGVTHVIATVAWAMLFFLLLLFGLALLGQFTLAFLVSVIRGRQGVAPLNGWRATCGASKLRGA